MINSLWRPSPQRATAVISGPALFLLIFLEIVAILDVRARVVLLRDGRYNSQYGHPGVKLRLTRRGADHVKEVGVKLLNEQLARLSGLRLTHPFSQASGLTGHIYLTDIQTLGYQPPHQSTISFAPPNYILFTLDNMAIQISARFLGVSGPFQVPGRVNGQLTGMRISLTTGFRATADGLMAVQVANCSSAIQHSQFVIDPEGPLSAIVKTFEMQINDLIRQRIPDLLCKGLQDLIEKNSPRLFQQLTQAQLTDHFQSFNGTSVIERFIRKFTEGLYIDGRNIADPIVTVDYFETQQRGELRYNNTVGTTPFHPLPMQADADADRMLYLYGSDYTLNSLLYHAYSSDRFTIKACLAGQDSHSKAYFQLEEANLPELYRGFVRTTCQSMAETNGDFLAGICVGKLIPAIEEHFPNATTKFLLVPHTVPEVRFVDGISTMDVQTRILTYVVERSTANSSVTVDRQILVSSADGVADIKLAAEDGKFSGDLKLRKLNVRLHRSAIGGIDPESISQLAPLAKTFLGPQLARGLKQGLPYPLKDSITFIRPELSIYNGFLRLATDFELVEDTFRQKVAEAFERIKNST